MLFHAYGLIETELRDCVGLEQEFKSLNQCAQLWNKLLAQRSLAVEAGSNGGSATISRVSTIPIPPEEVKDACLMLLSIDVSSYFSLRWRDLLVISNSFSRLAFMKMERMLVMRSYISSVVNSSAWSSL